MSRKFKDANPCPARLFAETPQDYLQNRFDLATSARKTLDSYVSHDNDLARKKNIPCGGFIDLDSAVKALTVQKPLLAGETILPFNARTEVPEPLAEIPKKGFSRLIIETQEPLVPLTGIRREAVEQCRRLVNRNGAPIEFIEIGQKMEAEGKEARIRLLQDDLQLKVYGVTEKSGIHPEAETVIISRARTHYKPSKHPVDLEKSKAGPALERSRRRLQTAASKLKVKIADKSDAEAVLHASTFPPADIAGLKDGRRITLQTEDGSIMRIDKYGDMHMSFLNNEEESEKIFPYPVPTGKELNSGLERMSPIQKISDGQEQILRQRFCEALGIKKITDRIMPKSPAGIYIANRQNTFPLSEEKMRDCKIGDVLQIDIPGKPYALILEGFVPDLKLPGNNKVKKVACLLGNLRR